MKKPRSTELSVAGDSLYMAIQNWLNEADFELAGKKSMQETLLYIPANFGTMPRRAGVLLDD